MIRRTISLMSPVWKAMLCLVRAVRINEKVVAITARVREIRIFGDRVDLSQGRLLNL